MGEPGITVSVEYINFIMGHIHRYGIDPARVYRESQFDSALLEVAGARVACEAFDRLWKTVERHSPDPDIGLHLGEKAFDFPGHILFIIMLNAPDIKGAVERFCDYFNLLSSISTPRLSVGPSQASLSVRFHTTAFEPSRHVYEGILASYLSALQGISRGGFSLDGVCFVHQRPADISEHRRIFRAPLLFGQRENKLVFQAENLERPISLSNNEVLKSLEQLAQRYQRQLNISGYWSDITCRIVEEMLEKKRPEMISVARQLGVSPRNLQYRLKREGVTFQQLLDQIRKKYALYFLEETDVTISDIAQLLGYSEQSVLNRAFKRWFGFTPGQYRSRIHASPFKISDTQKIAHP